VPAQKLTYCPLQGAGSDAVNDPDLPLSGQNGLINEPFQLNQRLFNPFADQVQFVGKTLQAGVSS
jgi:hypothetical protein